MIDVETRLRAGLRAFAAETAAVASPPPIESLVSGGGERVRRRRWPRLAVSFVAGTVVTTGAAAAVGVLPGPVESTLHEFRTWGFGANQGAERMASTTAGGFTYEVWRAPLDEGGQCVYERVIAPGGDVEHGGGAQCHGAPSSPRSRDRFGELAYPGSVVDNSTGRNPGTPKHSVAWGQLPIGATAVVFEFDDGSTLTITAEREGYFITTFPGVQDGLRIRGISALDAEGHVVAKG